MLIIVFSFERVNYLKTSNLIQKTKDSLFNKNYLDSVSYFEKAKQIARNKNNLKKYFKKGQLSNLYINYGLLLIDRKEFRMQKNNLGRLNILVMKMRRYR